MNNTSRASRSSLCREEVRNPLETKQKKRGGFTNLFTRQLFRLRTVRELAATSNRDKEGYHTSFLSLASR
jgi:hypothetical protein